MNPVGALRFAVRGINANKLRSLLTTLGILIGVAAVIVLLSVGTGSSEAVKQRLSALGTTTLTVNNAPQGTGRAFQGGGGAFALPGGIGGVSRTSSSSATRSSSTDLTLADAAALIDADKAPHVADIAPVVTAQSISGAYEGVTHTVGSFVGSTPSYLPINNWVIEHGTAFSDNDYTSRSNVAVIGNTVATNLFGQASDAVGRTVQFNSQNFVIRGVLKAKGSTGFQDQDDVVIAPLSTVQDKFTGVGKSLNNVIVRATGVAVIDDAQNEVYAILDARHEVTAADRDYTVQNPSSLVETATSTTKTLTVLLGAVAAISLLVGGIGVMNIMLVTVTERTREIGIRKAIGARKADIVTQFIAEAVMLTTFGAVLGVIAGLVGSQFRIVGIDPVVAPWSVFLAFGVAVAVGLFFGIYPANRAASLRPIDALRYE